MSVSFTGKPPGCFNMENRMNRSLMNLRTLTQDSWPSVALRELGSFERLFWLMDQDRPVHFGMAAQVCGQATPADWQRALLAVQRRHPLLSAYIEADERSVPQFRQSISAPIPLRTVLGKPESDWYRVMEEELVTPFDYRHPPLVRAVLIQGSGRAAFILLMHHSIGDASAAAYVIRDTLLELSGASLESLRITRSQDELFGDNIAATPSENGDGQPARPTEPAAGPLADLPGNMVIPKVQGLCLPAEFTAKLRARARSEDSSVHGALCAAVVLTCRETHGGWRDIPLRIVSPIETRTMLGVGDCCGCYTSAVGQAFESRTAYFWDLARLAKIGVAQAKNRSNVSAVIREFQGLLAGGLDVAGASNLVATAFAHHVMLSNLGEIPFAGQFGHLKLEALWGPAILPRFDDAQFIGVATLDGSLYLTHSGQAPPDGLLETMRSILVKACLK
jgi:hypothetical protein